MKFSFSLLLVTSLALCACQPAATQSSGPSLDPPAAATTADTPAASILPHPVETYTCERGTKLTVKLLGETAEVGVNGAEPISLPALGDDGTTFTDGTKTLMIVQGKLSYAVGRAAPEACTPD